MLCFSTSWQSPRWGRIVNLNGLFGLEVCMCVYVRVCSCMCLFWSMRAFKLQQGCVGWWLHAVNWPTRLFPCDAYFHGQTWIYHTHTHTQATHTCWNLNIKSLRARCYFQTLLLAYESCTDVTHCHAVLRYSYDTNLLFQVWKTCLSAETNGRVFSYCSQIVPLEIQKVFNR